MNNQKTILALKQLAEELFEGDDAILNSSDPGFLIKKRGARRAIHTKIEQLEAEDVANLDRSTINGSVPPHVYDFAMRLTRYLNSDKFPTFDNMDTSSDIITRFCDRVGLLSARISEVLRRTSFYENNRYLSKAEADIMEMATWLLIILNSMATVKVKLKVNHNVQAVTYMDTLISEAYTNSANIPKAIVKKQQELIESLGFDMRTICTNFARLIVEAVDLPEEVLTDAISAHHQQFPRLTQLELRLSDGDISNT